MLRWRDRKWLLLAAVVSLASIVSCSSVIREQARAERRVFAMGTWLDFEGTPSETALAASEILFASIRKSERTWSTWKSDSELARINDGRISLEHSVLRPQLERVLALSARLDGAFHPGLGRWIHASGIRNGKWNAGALAKLNRTTRIPRRPSDRAWLWEEGGFGKGLALDLAAEELAGRAGQPSDWSLNFGGQILHRGVGRREVAIAHPTDRFRPVGRLWIQNESIATSGQSENPGHILDPRTGSRAPDLGSATAIHPSALIADMVATALVVLGPVGSVEWWKRASMDRELGSTQWIWVERSGAVTATAGLQSRWSGPVEGIRWIR
jgi:thiamine biosynthesis lipoprotein